MKVLLLSLTSLIIFLFFCVISNILLALISLEFIGLIVVLSIAFLNLPAGEIILFLVFIFFVVESVLGLIGFVILISFRGADYLKESSQSYSDFA
jgi:hypothetical protein